MNNEMPITARTSALRPPVHNSAAPPVPVLLEAEETPVLRSWTSTSAVLEHLRQRELTSASYTAEDHEALYAQAVLKDQLQWEKQQRELLDALPRTDRQLLSALLSVPEDADDAAIDESHQAFFARIAELLARLDSEWIKKYSGFMADYVALFAKIGEAMNLLSQGLGAPDKDGNVTVDFGKLYDELEKIALELEAAGFGPEFDTREAAQAFLDELGLPDMKLVALPNGKFQIGVDPYLVRTLKDLFSGMNGTKLSAAQLQQLMSAKDTLLERFNHLNRTVPEKYQRQLQMWDQLTKILSSSIDSITEADRAFIQALIG